MKRRNLALPGVVTVLALGCSMDRYPALEDAGGDAASTSPSDGVVHVSIDAASFAQTLEGFGAAVAWYAEMFASYPENSPIYDVAFRDLGLDILRFRNHYGRGDPGSSSDISAEVEILARATASLGREPRILLSSWSPPRTLKASGKENCTGDRTTCTLAKDGNGQFVYDAFGAYFVDSLTYYAAFGVRPYYLSIQNEANFTPNGWEGCYFSPTETADYPGYDKALAATHAALSVSTFAPKLLGPECYSLGNDQLTNFLVPQTRELLYGGAHHLYQSSYWRAPDMYLAGMLQARDNANGLPLFQTEFDTDGAGSEGGFETAWVIHNSLVEEGVSGFLYWALVWGASPNSLIDMTNDGYTVHDQYYALRHFARYTDPGYVRVAALSSTADVRVSAYLAPDKQQMTVVLLNTAATDVAVTWDTISGFTFGSSEMIRSTFVSGDAGTSDLWRSLGSFDPNQSITMPTHSVMTLVLHAEAPAAS